MKPPVILKNNKRRFLSLLLALAGIFFGGELLAQTTIYTSTNGVLQVEVTANNPCEGNDDGFITFRVIAAQPTVTQVRMLFILGPGANYEMTTPFNIPIGGSYTFNGTDNFGNPQPGPTLIAGDYDFFIREVQPVGPALTLNTINTTAGIPSQPPVTLTELNTIVLTPTVNNDLTNSDCQTLEAELEILISGGSTVLPGGGSFTYTWTSDNGIAMPSSGTITGAAPVLNLKTLLAAESLPTDLPGGDYTLLIQDNYSSCSQTLIQTIVDPSPATFPVTISDASICDGESVTATMTSSEEPSPAPGVSYQLFHGASPVGAAQPAALGGGAVLFVIPASELTAAGSPHNDFTIVASNGSCTSASMTVPTITVNPLPAAPGVTFSPASVCVGQSINPPFITTPAGGSSYRWYSDLALSNFLVASTTPSNAQLSFSSASPNTTTVYVIERTSAGCDSPPTAVTLTVNANPTTSGITGTTPVCANTNGVAYSVVNTPGSTYAWTITGGTQASGTNTNSITVNWAAAGPGNVQVIETNAAGCVGTAVNFPVTINANPTTSAITGTTPVCANTNGVAYSVVNTPGSTYAWTITGGTQASGTNTNSITVNWGAAGPGNVQVIETNAALCPGTPVNFAVTINANPATSVITGSASVCANTNGISYSVVNTPGSTYAWTITGGTQASGTNTNSITVNWGAAGPGNVQVIETNAALCVGTAVNLPVTINANPTTSAITGTTPVCANTNGVSYSVVNTPGSTYAWTITGGTQASGTNTNSITVNWGAAGPGNVQVIETNAALCPGTPVNFAVTINANPATSVITGSASVCANTNGVAYSVVNTPGSTYAWTITGGTQASGTNTNSITVNWGAAGPGNVQVIETNAALCVGTAVNRPVTINANPTTSSITGTTPVCANTNGVAYSVVNTPGSTYAWTITGGTQASGTNTNSITVNWGAAGPGNVQVIETNAALCVGTAVNFPVTINANPTTSAITGTTPVCANTNGVAYSVVNTPGSTYAWTITGGTQASGTNTNSITVNWGAAGPGNVQVIETNATLCPGTPVNFAVTINANPATSVITGSASVCANTNGVAYSVVNTPGSTYAWTITGGTQASGTNTNSITVNWGAAGPGNVQVIETNAALCVGTAVNLPVTINANPTTSAITGTTPVCANTNGVSYSVVNTPGSTYAWTITGGTQASGTNTNSITVNWGAAGPGNVQVIETNAALCPGTPVNFAVTINANPATSVITGSASVCANTNGVSYSVVNTPGSTYAWTITGGTQASGTNTNSITVDWGAAGPGNVQVIETNAALCVGTAVNRPVTINANPTTSAITGTTPVCANANGVAYSVVNTPGSTYAWTITGGTQASGTNTNSITVNWGAAGPGNVQVIETNAALCVGTAVNLPVTINANPTTSAITGTTPVCANTNGVAYSVVNTPGSTYAWTITGGVQASGTNTNSITVNWGAAGPGNVQVIETNAALCPGTPVNFAVTINANPATSVITGSASVCANTNGVAYSVVNTPGSTYAWTITGGTQASGTNTNSITVNWGAAGPGNVQVIETNAALCVGTAVNLPVTINANPTTSAITGTTPVCANTNGVSYSVVNTPGSTYAWTITGGTQASGTNTNSITVNWGAAGPGNVQVIETNAALCAGTAVNLAVTIDANPTTSAITGPVSVCENSTGVAYSVVNTPGSTYAWTITGGTQVSGTNTNSITVDWGAAGPGNVQVVETSAALCVGAPVNLGVTINGLAATSAITGTTPVCENATGVGYSVVNTPGSTYAWTITGGTQASGTNTNSITVDWGAAGPGNVQVTETTVSGCAGSAVNFPVVINANPTTSAITGTTPVCANTNGVAYSVVNTPGSTYAWTITGGTQASGTNTNSITVDWGAAGPGNVQVVETNAALCVGTAVNLAVTIEANPSTSAITGTTPVCANSTGVAYSVVNTPGSTYAWTITGGSQASGTNTNSITVDWGAAGAGNVQVVETNAALCVGTAVNLAVTIDPIPAAPAITFSPTSYCVGATISSPSVTAPVVGSTYRWYSDIGLTSFLVASTAPTNAQLGFSSVAANTTTVYVTETSATGCEGSATPVTLTVNAPPVATVTPTSASCSGVNDGQIDFTGSTGAPTLEYSIDNGANFQPGVLFTGLATGTYQAVVRDGNGCTSAPQNITITATTSIIPTISKSDASCNGITNGSITVTGVTGGTAPYGYSITNGAPFQVSNTFTNLAGGSNHSVVVRDASGCLSSAFSIVINNTNTITASVAKTDVAACVGNDGTITVSAPAGGTSPYEFSLNGGAFQASGNFTGLTPNSYSIVVRDAGLCLSSPIPVTIGTISNIVPVVSKVDATCSGLPNGSITISSVTGGTGGYTYSIDNGANFVPAFTFNALAGGTNYAVVVKDAAGCLSSSIAIIINNTNTLVPTIVKTDVSSCVGTDGEIQITGETGGTGPYTYSINNGTTFQASNTFSTLSPGTYQVVIKDTPGCQSAAFSTTIGVIGNIIPVISKSDASCNGVNSGSITVSSVTGGTGPYEYSRDNGTTFQPANTFSTLSAGTYSVVVRDAALCVSSVTTVVIQNGLTVVPGVNTTNVSCAGGDGVISVPSVTGGTGPYEYSINGGGSFQASSTFTSIAQGVYSVIVRDNSGCLSAPVTASVSSNCNGGGGPGGPGNINCTVFTINVVESRPTCGGQDDGEITLTVTGGTPSPNYVLTLYDSTANPIFTKAVVVAPGVAHKFDQLSASTNYFYQVDDGTNLCRLPYSLPLQTTVQATLDLASVTNPTCFGSATGSAVINATGSGTGQYFYSIDNLSWKPFVPGTPGQIADLPPLGTYNILVGESIGDVCHTSVEVTINSVNPDINATFSITPATCDGADGAITNIVATGGSGAGYVFSIDGINYATANNFTGLTGGFYSIRVRDGGGCEKVVPANVTFPGFINFSYTVVDPTCSNNGNSGALVVKVLDPGTYTMAVSQDQFNEPADSEYRNYSDPFITFDNLSRGTYFIYAKSNTAVCPTRSEPIAMQGAYALSFEVNPTCVANDLSLTLTNITGEPGVPFEIQVYRKTTGVLVETIQRSSISATATEFLEYQSHTFLRNADDYRLQMVQISPATNCQITSPFVDVVVPNEVFALIGPTEKSYPDIANGSLEVTNISGGGTPYQVRIELDSASSFNFPDYETNFTEPDLNANNQYGKKFDNIPPGRYVVQVMDNVGCVLELMARVKMDVTVYIPNIFTPNGDEINDLFFIRNLPVDNAELIITSRWGKEVFSSKNYQNNWNGEGAADGVYFYQLSIGGEDAITGWVEILRGEKP